MDFAMHNITNTIISHFFSKCNSFLKKTYKYQPLFIDAKPFVYILGTRGAMEHTIS